MFIVAAGYLGGSGQRPPGDSLKLLGLHPIRCYFVSFRKLSSQFTGASHIKNVTMWWRSLYGGPWLKPYGIISLQRHGQVVHEHVALLQPVEQHYRADHVAHLVYRPKE